MNPELAIVTLREALEQRLDEESLGVAVAALALIKHGKVGDA